MLVSADCYLAVERARFSSATARRGSITCKRNYTARKAESFLRTWAKEDVYFTLDREIELLKDAGFATEVTWRKDSFAVLVGLK